VTAIAPIGVAARHIPALDGVRGLAVLTVMILHFTVIKPAAGAGAVLVDIIGLGWAGVDLFFVLSGFLITGILVDTKGNLSYFRNFYVRRALRIFPLFYAFLLIVLVLWPAVSATPADSLSSKLITATYLGNFLMAFGGWEALPGHTTHLWSLAVEEQFYLIWPFVIYLLPRHRKVQLCAAVIMGAWLLRVGFHSLWPTGIPGYVLLPARVDTLAAGGLLALLVRRDGWEVMLRPWVSRLVLVGVTLLLVTLAVDPVAGDGPFAPLDLHVQMLAYPGVMALSLALVLWAVLPTPGGSRHPFIEAGALRRLGQISYGMYLLHIPLRNLMVNRVFPDSDVPELLGSEILTQLLIVLAGIGITYVVAAASWKFFESPILRFKRYFETARPLIPNQTHDVRLSSPSDAQRWSS
jgi:peptidoglycan/LPS O-acetylase OafA/YrhL